MYIVAQPWRIFKIHVTLIFLLFCANTAGIVLKLFLDYDFLVFELINLFNFDTEKNVPTLFSSIMMIICAGLLYIIAIYNKKNNLSFIPWLGLSLIFLFLSIDEISSLHEKLSVPTREYFNTTEYLYYAWVIPYSILLVIFLIAYGKFLFSLPRNIMMLFVISGFTFVAGALGFEMLGGNQIENIGTTNNLLYSILYTCEESLEMIGIAIFLYALLTYVVTHLEFLTISVVYKNSEIAQTNRENLQNLNEY